MPIFTSPNDIAFNIFGIEIYYYGLFMALGILSSIFVANKLGNKYFNLNNLLIDISVPILISGIIGARLYYCALNYDYYIYNCPEIFFIRGGGLSIHGAIIGGAICLFFQAKKQKFNFGNICDIFACTLPLGQAIARWGNFFNSEAFGTPTNLPWKLFIPLENRPEMFINYEYFHPAFLYESILDILIFIILLTLINRDKQLPIGNISAIYIIMYSIARIIVESIRIDSQQIILGVPFPTFISILLILFATLFLIKKAK